MESITSTSSVRGLVTITAGEHRLVGGRCDDCATHVFPVQAHCPRCGGPMSATELPTTGRVWSCTVQRTRPKPPYQGPDEFEPFAVAYVDLGPLRVEARLEGKPVANWRIGDAVHLVAGEPDEDGGIWSYRFAAGDAAPPGDRS